MCWDRSSLRLNRALAVVRRRRRRDGNAGSETTAPPRRGRSFFCSLGPCERRWSSGLRVRFTGRTPLAPRVTEAVGRFVRWLGGVRMTPDHMISHTSEPELYL